MANFRFDDDFSLPKGERARITSNIQAIELLKTLETEERQASEDEKFVLARYVGWGGLPQVFNPEPDSRWVSSAEALRAALDPEEYDAAFESTLNAHYTSGLVIQEIYRGLEHLGFSGGRILEPSMGTGNFLGHMPVPMALRSEVTGIELDSITGRIAKQLYPDHEIYVRGFQATPLPQDYFDLAISNVPFGDYPVADPEYDSLNLRIHNYFFARSLDRVRPGGLVAFVTSTGTMQSQSGKQFRAWLSERSNLVGAMRLPGDAFKEVAGTEVTTDLIILQKLGREIPNYEHSWIELAETSIQDAEGNSLRTNEYYVRHPEMMLGELADDTLFPGRLALKSDGRDLSGAIQKAFDAMPSNIYRHRIYLDSTPELDSLRVKLPPDATVKPFGYLAQGDVLWQRQGDWLYPANLKEKTSERVLGMLKVRDAVQQVFDVQLNRGTDEDLRVTQQKLNQVYDAFVREHGNLTDSANMRAFQADPDAQLVTALERVNPETKAIEKAEVFFQRTVRPRMIKNNAGTAQEALLASLNEYGEVVPGYMAQLLGQKETEVLHSLQTQNLVFQDPVSHRWLTEDDYLSGDVRHKLVIAQRAIQENPQYQVNVEALKAIQPRDLEPGEIEVRLGAPWLPTEIIADFAYELLEVSPEEYQIEVAHNAEYAVWSVEYHYALNANARNNSVYGTKHLSALELLEQSLSLKDATVYYRDQDGNYRVDAEPTIAARLKQQILQDQFKGWIWQDFDRAEKLCRMYNDLYNGSIVREFRNPSLEMPGSSPEIELRPHQKDAVWRILQSKSTLLGHVVGAGKTYTMIAGALEMRRLNIAQKPMIVVPNHMLGQFTRELYQLYPNAKVLAPSEKDTQKKNRKQLMAKIATGDWDAVIVTHSAFTRLPVSKAEQMKYLQGQLEELNRLMGDSDVKRGNGVVKQLARERQRLKERVAKITNATSKDDGVSFEQLGVDALFVDEAHFWKNLGRLSKLKNIAGLSNTSSQRAMDAFIKTQIIRRNGGRLVFATGTPISNSIAEMYTMQRFLQPESLKAKHISNFDSWVGNFADKVTAPEIDPTGRFKTKTRLARFTNVPELMAIFRDVADIRTAKQLDLPRPEVNRFTISAQASSLQLSYMERLITRAENIQAKLVEPDEDNMLWVTTDGRRVALEPRLLAPDLPDFPESKVNQAIANIHAIWAATEQQRLTQMVFCDLGTPKKAKEGEKPPFSIYQHIKAGLMVRGIPADDIAFIHDAGTSKEKEKLYAQMREGKTRILIGSTEKCGVGMNIQTRLFAEHHLDPPWRPSDIEQREGRILRQGNLNSQIMLLTYVTQGRDGQLGFDSYSWQTLARKAEMVAQVMDGDTAVRAVDDITSQSLSFDEVKAIATGNPLIIEKADVDNRVSELSRYKQAFINERYTIQRQFHSLPQNIASYKQEIAQYKEDIPRRQPTKGDAFQLTVGSRVFDKRKEAGGLLLNYMAKAQVSGKTGSQSIGWYGGFELIANNTGYGQYFHLKSPSGKSYTAGVRDTPMAAMNSLDAALDEIPKLLSYTEQKLAQSEASLVTLSQDIDRPFEYENELQSLLERQLEINKELGLNKDDAQQIVTEESEESPAQDKDTKPEETQELVDLDSISSKDQEWEWGDVDWETNIHCEASPEVLEALSQFVMNSTLQVSPAKPLTEQHEFTADQSEASVQQATQSPSDTQNFTEAIVADQSVESQQNVETEKFTKPELRKVPEVVQDRVRNAIATIQNYNEQIEHGRSLDARFGGDGRYEYEIHEKLIGGVQQSLATIEKFRGYAPNNNVDAAKVLAELEFNEPTALTVPAKEWEAEKVQSEQQPPTEAPKPETTEQLSLQLDSSSKPETDLKQSFDQKLQQGDLTGALEDSIQLADETKAIAERSAQHLEQKAQNWRDDFTYYYFEDLNLKAVASLGDVPEDIQNYASLGDAVSHFQKAGCINRNIHTTKNEFSLLCLEIMKTGIEKWGEVIPHFYRGVRSSRPDSEYKMLYGSTDEEVASAYGEVKIYENIKCLRTYSLAQSVVDFSNQADEELIFLPTEVRELEMPNELSTSIRESAADKELQFIRSEQQPPTEEISSQLDSSPTPDTNLNQPFEKKLQQGDLTGALDDSIHLQAESKAIAQDARQSLQDKRDASQELAQQTLDRYPLIGEDSKASPEPEPESPAIAAKETTKQILPPQQQGGQAAKNVAQLLHDAGIDSAILAGKDFHLRAEQPHFRPFVVERHSDQLYLTHYNKINGDQFIEAELVFQIGDRGNLSLQETASFNPFTGGELRNKDHGFAAQFSSNLLEQDWAIALATEFSKTREEMNQDQVGEKLEQQAEEVRSPVDSSVQNSKDVPMTPENWVKVAQAVGHNSDYVARVAEVQGKSLSEPGQAVMKKDFAKHRETLDDLRTWYKAAVIIAKPQGYLDSIRAIAEQFKDGQPIESTVRSMMNLDLYEGAYKKLEQGLDISKGESVLQEVAKRAFKKGMPLEYVNKVLLQGNQGLRDTHKLQPKQTEQYVNQVLGKTIQQLPGQMKDKISKQFQALPINNQKQKDGGISL